MSKVLKSTYFGHAWLCTPKMIRSTKTFVFIWRQKLILILHGPFFPKFGQNEFFWKKSFCWFLNIQIIYHQAKNEKKLITDSWEKCQTNGQTDRQATRQTNRHEDRQRDRRPNGQTNNGDFIGPCERRGSKKKERQKYKTKFKTDVRHDPNNWVNK